jgi:CBS domain-containing protein
MQARDAARKPPVTVAPETRIAEVAALMDQAVVGGVVVVDGDRPVGIVTDRDLAVRALARRVPYDGRVDSVMSTDLVTLDASADLRNAIRIFSSHPIRRLPLLDGGRMVGMITIDDLVVDVTSDLAELIRPLTGQLLFGHPEPAVPAPAP